MQKASERLSRPVKQKKGSKNQPKLNILYVSVTGKLAQPYLDPSTRYRCYYPVEAARSLGHRAFVTTQARLDTVDPALFDLVVIHRPTFIPALVRFVDAAARAGVRLVADYDDLIFDPACAAESSMFVRSWNFTEVQATFERNTDALRLFNEFTVSTAPLRENVLALSPGALVHILPNSVSPSLWSLIAGRDYQQRESRPFLGYFPGTATHDEDFRIAAADVATFCRERQVPLRIIGPIRTDQDLFRNVEVEHQELQPYDVMFDSLSSCRVVLAPLTFNRFNRAKSHIKLVEAGLSCTSCVASAIPDMTRHHDLIGHGTLVEGDADWSGAISRSWDAYDLKNAVIARNNLVQAFGSVNICRPLFDGVVA